MTVALLLIGVVSTAALVFVAYPLINPKRHLYYLEEMLGLDEEKKLAYLQSKKQLVYDNIKDLEFEHQMGKLTKSDFERLREGLIGEAEDVTKEIDNAEVKRDIESLIEDEVRSRRKT